MSYHEMACDAGYGPGSAGHAEMEAMAEAQHQHEFEVQCEAEAQAQADAAQAEAEAEAAQYSARDEIIQNCGNCYYGYVHQGPFKCLRPDDAPCCHHSYWKCITSPIA